MRTKDRERRDDGRPVVGLSPALERVHDVSLVGKSTSTPAGTALRPLDLDLLRLSYVCRADALLRGRPERSWVLSKIHRFFDASPDPASAGALSLRALIDAARADAAPLDDA